MINMSQVVQTSDFNPRPPRGGRRQNVLYSSKSQRISIHALREEGDNSYKDSGIHTYLFQSTPSARRATDKVLEIIHKYIKFQSTPSARRATWFPSAKAVMAKDFNPRPPRGGRPFGGLMQVLDEHIFQSTPSARRATFAMLRGALPDWIFQSTPSARRATTWACTTTPTPPVFQSTPSARRATTLDFWHYADNYISIHALREEGDCWAAQKQRSRS